MVAEFISSILIFLSSTVKFALGASAVVTGNLGVSGTIANVLGGITGILIFTYLGSHIRLWFIRLFPQQFDRKFTKGSRFLVRVKQHSGLFGVAFLTPILLSIPIGVMLALDLTNHKRKIVTSMVFSCIFWSAVFFVPYYVFNIDLIGWVKSHKF
jgi:energy-converting hydrogenase Eha subunit A